MQEGKDLKSEGLKVAYVGGGWASNIGNAYYNLGAIYLLRKVFGGDGVFMVPDVASWAWKVDNNFELLPQVKADLLVLSGPTLCSDSALRYEKVFEEHTRRGGKIAYLSAGAASYTEEESNSVVAFLSRYESNIAFFATRDSKTFQLYDGKLVVPMFDGICTSMFLDFVVNLPEIAMEPYVVFNFGVEEPNIVPDQNGGFKCRPRGRLKAPQAELDGLPVVRTESRRYDRDPKKMFALPNTFYWDIPEGFLTLYANAHHVFSNRVHTCASTLILGGRAMYVPTSARSRDGRRFLFERIGVGQIYEKPVSLDRAYIDEERSKLVNFLSSLTR